MLIRGDLNSGNRDMPLPKVIKTARVGSQARRSESSLDGVKRNPGMMMAPAFPYSAVLHTRYIAEKPTPFTADGRRL